jgi:phospholipase C
MRSFGARLAVALVAAIAGSGFIAAGAAVPITAAHFVSHRVHDHTSILQFIERRFGLPALTHRDAHANPMLEFFDFEHPSFARPPVLPAAPLDAVGAANCAGLGSGSGGV